MQKNLSRALSAAAFIGLSALGGCVIAVDGDGDAYEANWDLDREYEILKAADVSGNTVTARVKSNGCTTKEFIDADVRKMNDNRFSVGFHRERPDYCRALLEDGGHLRKPSDRSSSRMLSSTSRWTSKSRTAAVCKAATASRSGGVSTPTRLGPAGKEQRARAAVKAAAASGCTVVLHDVACGAPLRSLVAGHGVLYALALSPDAACLLASGAHAF